MIDWIKTLNFQYLGKHIYCAELDKEFGTIASAAKYLIDNNLYTVESKNPIQSLITLIGKNIRGKIPCVPETNYTFEEVPGTQELLIKVYCPQLDKTFDSQNEAAKYFINNNIWTGIKTKTAKTRITDIINGAFSDYCGYTFLPV